MIRLIARRRLLHRPHSSTYQRRTLYGVSSAIPVTETCPSPTCACAAMPAGLDIDHKTPLEGTMARYDMHISVASPRLDWSSRFEEDAGLAAQVKNLFGRKGPLYNPTFNTLVTAHYTHDHGPSDPATSTLTTVPGFRTISLSHLPSTDGVVEPASLVSALESLLPEAYFSDRSRSSSAPPLQSTPLEDPLIQICGHMSRDSRCGILGPLLRAEFETASARTGVPVQTSLVTHIGGHKYAGNVIIYIPPGFARSGNALAGMGVWYGRVEPRHVAGLLEETVGRGRVVRDLFRGAVGPWTSHLGSQGLE